MSSEVSPLIEAQQSSIIQRPYHFPGELGCVNQYLCCCTLSKYTLSNEEVWTLLDLDIRL